MWDAIADWEQKLQRQGHLASRTQFSYVQDVRRFATWVQAQYHLRSSTLITVRIAAAYREYLRVQEHTSSTIERAMMSLQAFAEHSNDGAINPFRIVHLSDLLALHLALALSAAEWQAVSTASQRRVRRDQGMAWSVATLYHALGLQTQELVRLRESDVTTTRAATGIHLSSGHVLPLDEEATEAIYRYRQQRSANGTAALFLGQRGQVTERGMRLLLEQLGQEAHLERPLNPTVLQATFLDRIFLPKAYGCHWTAVAYTLLQELHQHQHPPLSAITDIPWLIAQIHAFMQVES